MDSRVRGSDAEELATVLGAVAETGANDIGA